MRTLRIHVLVVLAALCSTPSSAAPKGPAPAPPPAKPAAAKPILPTQLPASDPANDPALPSFSAPPACREVSFAPDADPETTGMALDARATLRAAVALMASPTPEQRAYGYTLLKGLFWDNWGLTDRWLDRYLPEVQCGELWGYARRYVLADALITPEPFARKNRGPARQALVILGIPEGKSAALAALKETKTSEDRVALVYLYLLSANGQRPWKEPAGKAALGNGLTNVDLMDQAMIGTLSQAIPADDPAQRAIGYYRRLLDTYGLLYVEENTKVVEARDIREGSLFRRPLGSF